MDLLNRGLTHGVLDHHHFVLDVCDEGLDRARSNHLPLVVRIVTKFETASVFDHLSESARGWGEDDDIAHGATIGTAAVATKNGYLCLRDRGGNRV